MFIGDAYDDILARKAEEAPGGIAPLNPSWTSPDYDPVKVAEWAAAAPAQPSPLPAQITITGKRIPPTPAPIQIPLLNFTQGQTLNPWDAITARRGAMIPAPPLTSGSYWPWIVGGLAGLAALMLLMGRDKGKSPAPRSRSPRVAFRRPAFARRRR